MGWIVTLTYAARLAALYHYNKEMLMHKYFQQLEACKVKEAGELKKTSSNGETKHSQPYFVLAFCFIMSQYSLP